jgi:hypothetical protein
MLKIFLYILVVLLPVMNRAVSTEPMSAKEDLPDLYTSLNLSEKGLSNEIFQLALKGHHKLVNDCKLRNPGILTIADFSQPSSNKRLYVIDLDHKTLLFNTYVAHGRNTGGQYAEHFSNAAGSYQSSLGFYITRQEIRGSSVGLSLVLDGVEKGINDNAYRREIIMHGADYATESFIRRTGRLGRSFGCPAVPPELIKPVVESIKEGTCLFIYSDDDQYLKNSALINNI